MEPRLQLSIPHIDRPTVPPTVVAGVAAVGSHLGRLHGLQLHLLLHLFLLLLHHVLQGQVAVLPQLDPLVGVAHTGVLYQGGEHHEETGKQIDVDGLHVGYLGQGGVDGVDEGGHGEDSGDAQSYSGWSCSSVEPEGDPGHDHYETTGDVNLVNIILLIHDNANNKF